VKTIKKIYRKRGKMIEEEEIQIIKKVNLQIFPLETMGCLSEERKKIE